MDNIRFFPITRSFPAGQQLLKGFYHNQNDTPLHRQEFAEIVFVLDGTADYETRFPGETEKISRGSIMIVPADGKHGYLNTENLRIFALLFVPDRLPLPLLNLYIHPRYRQLFGRNASYYERTGKNYPRQDFSDGEFSGFEQLIELFNSYQNGSTPGYSCEKMGIFMCLLGRICDQWNGDDPAVREKMPLDLEQITSFMAKNIDRELSLQELADEHSMAVNTLLRHFRKIIGKTPMAYMRELRLRAAEELLINSALRIEEIAVQCGFGSSSHFIMVFKKHFGMTPENFRYSKNAEKIQPEK